MVPRFGQKREGHSPYKTIDGPRCASPAGAARELGVFPAMGERSIREKRAKITPAGPGTGRVTALVCRVMDAYGVSGLRPDRSGNTQKHAAGLVTVTMGPLLIFCRECAAVGKSVFPRSQGKTWILCRIASAQLREN